MNKGFEMVLKFTFNEKGTKEVEKFYNIDKTKNGDIDLDDLADTLNDCGIISELNYLPYENMETKFILREE